MRRSLPGLLASILVVVGFLAGCGSSSTEPLDGPLFFVGEIAAQGSEFHTFTVVSRGIIRVQVVRLAEKVAEGTEPLGFALTVGLALGRPIDGECVARYSVRATEGTLEVFELNGAEFCLRVFDSGLLLADQVAEYTVSVSAG